MTVERVLIAIAGVLALTVAIALMLDATTSREGAVAVERRRRPRAERSRAGEFLIGLGLCSLSASLFGTDRWRFRTVALLVSAVLVTTGALLNRRLLVESVRLRGAARRR